MIQLLTALPALAEASDMVPSTCVKQFTVICNLHSRGSNTLFWSLPTLHSCMHTHIFQTFHSLKRKDMCFGHHSLHPGRNQKLPKLKSSKLLVLRLQRKGEAWKGRAWPPVHLSRSGHGAWGGNWFVGVRGQGYISTALLLRWKKSWKGGSWKGGSGGRGMTEVV